MKITKLTLTLILIFSCILGVSACHPLALSNHKHSYAKEWSHDDDSHWKSCTVDGCTEISGKVSHTFGEPVVTEAEISKDCKRVYTCTICNGTKVEIIPALDHTHVASTDWISNTEGHWNLCESGCDAKLNSTPHVWDGGKVTVEATSGKAGTVRYTCMVCQFSRNETIPALPDKMSEAEWIAYFIFDNVRIDATFIIPDFGGSEGVILIDGEYAEVTADGETYVSIAEQETADIDFSNNYNDFNHIGNGVYYASSVTLTYDEVDTEFSNVSVTLNGGRISTISYTMDLFGMSCEFNYVFSEWGNVTVESPALSDEDLAAALNPENFTSYSMEIIEYDASFNYVVYDYIFDGDSYVLTVYTDEDAVVTEGNVENAGIILNFPLTILNQLSADNFVYDPFQGAFVLSDTSLIKDNVTTFAITIENGYLTNIYIACADGSEMTYYLYDWGNEEENNVLSPDMYTEILDPDKYYNCTYETIFVDTDFTSYSYSYVCDGNKYLYVNYYENEAPVCFELENAGVVLHPLLEMLNSLDALDFVYDTEAGGYYCDSSIVSENGYNYIVIIIEDGYLTVAYGEHVSGGEYYFLFYDYGTSVVS